MLQADVHKNPELLSQHLIDVSFVLSAPLLLGVLAASFWP